MCILLVQQQQIKSKNVCMLFLQQQQIKSKNLCIFFIQQQHIKVKKYQHSNNKTIVLGQHDVRQSCSDQKKITVGQGHTGIQTTLT